jgi:uncharacterized protein
MVQQTLEQRIRRDLLGDRSIGPEVERILLFGSVARGTATEESDIDLVVVLNRSGFTRTYAEMLENRLRVGRALAGLSKEVALDVLAYTHDEWEQVRGSSGDFAKRLNSEARELV